MNFGANLLPLINQHESPSTSLPHPLPSATALSTLFGLLITGAQFVRLMIMMLLVVLAMAQLFTNICQRNLLRSAMPLGTKKLLDGTFA